MVKDYIRSHHFHKTVEAFCRNPFEESVCLPVIPDAVHDVTAFIVFIYHSVYGINIVLQVSIHTDGRVAVGLYRHKTGQNSVLMAFVVGQADT